jgi:serine/threonine-protein kinase
VPAVALLMILGVGVALFGTVGAAMLGLYARGQRPGTTPPEDPPTVAPIAAGDDDSAAGTDGLASEALEPDEDELPTPGEPSTPVPEPWTPAPPEPPTPEPVTAEPATPEPPTPAVLPPPPVYDSDEPGVIIVNAVPWSEVYLDGRVFQRTPIMSRQIPAGRHELRVVCGTCGSHQEATVIFEVAPGETWSKTDFRFHR